MKIKPLTLLAGFFILYFFAQQLASKEKEIELPDLKELYKKTVMFIAVDYKDSDGEEKCKVGTGFIVSSSGYVITSLHLIQNKNKTFDQPYLISGVIGENSFDCKSNRRIGDIKELIYVKSIPDQDVMLLKIKSDEVSFDYIKACQETKVRDGENLFVLGYPLGLPLNPTFATLGYRQGFHGFWQINGQVNEGNSGGPVFNRYGRLIGLVYGGFENAQNYAFMVPLNHFKEFIINAGSPIEACATLDGSSLERTCDRKIQTHKVDFVLDEHSSFNSVSRLRETAFNAEDGYVIRSYEWVEASANNASGADISIIENGKKIRVTTQLTSGPAFDRWRGWLEGTISTVQEPENCGR